jgi:LysR family nitrogen assimilation transcriptional regulator
VTPRQLKYFVEIARTGSITTAAATLHIAQPALSHHIAAMEQELGVPLLQRHARGVRLTAEGQRLLDRAASILRQLDRLHDDVRESAGNVHGSVSLCVVGSVAPVLAIPLLRLLGERAPRVRLQLSTGMSREARALVEARRVDLALLPVAAELSRLESVPVFEERFCLFGQDFLFEGETGPIRFADIGDRPLVAPDRDHDLRKMIERLAVAQGCALNVQYELNNPELYRRVVQEGLAFAIMPRNAFADAETFHVQAREIVEPVIERAQSLVWMVDHPLTPAGETVRSALLDLVDRLIDEGTLKARRLAAGRTHGGNVEP